MQNDNDFGGLPLNNVLQLCWVHQQPRNLSHRRHDERQSVSERWGSADTGRGQNVHGCKMLLEEYREISNLAMLFFLDFKRKGE